MQQASAGSPTVKPRTSVAFALLRGAAQQSHQGLPEAPREPFRILAKHSQRAHSDRKHAAAACRPTAKPRTSTGFEERRGPLRWQEQKPATMRQASAGSPTAKPRTSNELREHAHSAATPNTCRASAMPHLRYILKAPLDRGVGGENTLNPKRLHCGWSGAGIQVRSARGSG